jgi:MinD-like ATPase involved in chromosome partitioning or flagellar assembly
VTTIGLYGCKQGPGVTTLALALASVLDDDGGAVLVEADAQGGDLAALIGRPPLPGLLSLAAAGRNGALVDADSHVQQLPAGGKALLAPSDPLQVAAALTAVGDRVIAMARASFRHVVVDRGRGESQVGDDLAVLVCHATLAGVEQARVRSEALEAVGADVRVVISAVGPYRPDEVSAALARPVVLTIPRDPRGASGLSGDGNVRALRRAPILRAAATLADELLQDAEAKEPSW